MNIDEIRRLHAEAASEEGKAGFGRDGKGRAAMWAGAGVGLVRSRQGAATIMEKVRRGAVDAIDAARLRL